MELKFKHRLIIRILKCAVKNLTNCRASMLTSCPWNEVAKIPHSYTHSFPGQNLTSCNSYSHCLICAKYPQTEQKYSIPLHTELSTITLSSRDPERLKATKEKKILPPVCVDNVHYSHEHSKQQLTTNHAAEHDLTSRKIWSVWCATVRLAFGEYKGVRDPEVSWSQIFG